MIQAAPHGRSSFASSSNIVNDNFLQEISGHLKYAVFKRCNFAVKTQCWNSQRIVIEDITFERCIGNVGSFMKAIDSEKVISLAMKRNSRQFNASVIEGTTKLEKLEFQNCTISLDLIQALHDFNNLGSLWISDCTVSDAAALKIASLKSVKRLWLHLNSSKEPFAFNTIIKLLGMRELQFINLLGRIGPESIPLLRDYGDPVELVY